MARNIVEIGFCKLGEFNVPARLMPAAQPLPYANRGKIDAVGALTAQRLQ
jgi:hypothetical protein